MSGCPADDLWTALTEGRLAANAEAELHRHIDFCAECRAMLVALCPARGPSSSAEDVGTGPTVPHAPPWEPPREFDQYRLIRPLGRGAMGRVYLGHDTSLDRPVAVKFISAEQPSAAARERFVIEARALARLQHPNVVAVYRVGEVAGRPFLVSELVEGQGLDRAPRPLPSAEALRTTLGLARGLAAIHGRGVLHRDIKPANVVVGSDGEAKLIDFGLAKLAPDGPPGPGSPGGDGGLTGDGDLLGTPRYMAPECWRGEQATQRSDVYSLGALLYELCAGRPPLDGPDLAALREAVQERDVQPLLEAAPATAPGLAAIVDRCLRREPAARFESGEELLQAIQALQRFAAGPPQAPRGRRQPIMAAALAAALLVGGAAYMVRREPAPVQRAAAVGPRRILAVLGFANTSRRPDATWISPALEEVLNASLASGGALRIVPRVSVERMKGNLSLADGAFAAQEALGRVRGYLGTDLVVSGSYVAAGGGLRVDLRLQEAATGAQLAVLSEAGEEARLPDLALRLGERLRGRLGLGKLSEEQRRAALGSLPTVPGAARAYSAALVKVDAHDLPAARDLLQRAAELSPDDPHVCDVLAGVWAGLGDDDRRREHAQRAFEHAAALGAEERSLVEARYRSARGEHDKAVEIYRRLFSDFPDSLEYGLSLAGAQISADREHEALATLAKLRELPRPTRDDPWIAITQGRAERSLSDMPAAIRSTQEGAEKGHTRGDRSAVVAALVNQGSALVAAGRLDEAGAVLEQSRAMAAALGERAGVGWTLDAIGHVRVRRGDLRGAVAAYEEGAEIFRELGAHYGRVITLNHAAAPLWRSGDLARARERAGEGLALGRQIKSMDGVAGALLQLLDIELAAGRLPDAERACRDASGWIALTDKYGMARVSVGRARQLAAQGELPHATQELTGAVALLDQGGRRTDAADGRRWLALVELRGGHPEQAAALARDAVAELHAEGARDAEASARAVLARALLAQGQAAAASEEVEEARRLTQESQDVQVLSAVRLAQARVHAAAGSRAGLGAARAAAQAALREATRAGLVPEQQEAGLVLAEIARRVAALR